MSELTDILDAIEERAARGEPMALATIVATRGSTYRRAGARLLVPESGEPIGNISGGCLEGDVARIGREVLRTGEARTVEFDLTAEDDAVWGYGLGCNGAIELYVEPTQGAVEHARALRAALAGEPTVLVTVISGPRTGTRWFGTDGAAGAALAAGTPRVEESADGERVFYEPMLPTPHLVVCAAGHDAIPLVRQAAELGWRVTVADVRRALLTHERFPGAADFCDADPERIAEAVPVDGRTAIVLMSHNYLRDQAYLRSFLEAGVEPAYFGVLGPRGRTEQMLGEIGRPEAMERLHAPAGLDIGAEGPEEVARAIVAEILAVMRGRSGRPLRDRPGPIHGDQPPM
ncbi:MAG TPA: XdhC family protein [candidate division Zixibacteria bacterium]|nr:XdhC family protein [candidate division Zixibacteria bacterium]